MSTSAWTDVDRHIASTLLADTDPVFAEILAANAAAGLPAIDVSPAQGKFLNLLVTISRARSILEIGTLGGYSTVWMASALPAGGRVVTLEYSPHHAEIARANVARAALADRIDIRVGRAADTLPMLADEGQGPFDLVFIDADKPGNPIYLDWAMRLTVPGSVIVCDNVIRDGRVLETDGRDASVVGARAALDFIASNPRLDGTALQTVGLKGYDGFAIAVVR